MFLFKASQFHPYQLASSPASCGLNKKQPIFLPALNFLHIFAGFDLAIVSVIATTGLEDI